MPTKKKVKNAKKIRIKPQKNGSGQWELHLLNGSAGKLDPEGVENELDKDDGSYKGLPSKIPVVVFDPDEANLASYVVSLEPSFEAWTRKKNKCVRRMTVPDFDGGEEDDYFVVMILDESKDPPATVAIIDPWVGIKRIRL